MPRNHDRRTPTSEQRKGMTEALLRSPTYRRAYQDPDFMQREELRPLRLDLELLKPEMALTEHDIRSTIVVFGSARIAAPEEARARAAGLRARLRSRPRDPELLEQLGAAERLLERSRYYEQAREFGRLVTRASQRRSERAREFVIVTGGGPGIMEAANRGAYEAGGKSIGLNITLPNEQVPNPFVTPELCFLFHYFAIRKMHFLMRAKAMVAFPGGFGTLDELFEALTLVQTGKKSSLPIVLFGKEFWSRVVNFQTLAYEGVISPEDLGLIRYVETAREAWEYIREFWRRRGAPASRQRRTVPAAHLDERPPVA